MESKLGQIGIEVEDLSSALGNLVKIFQLSNVSVLDYQKDEVHYKIAFVHFGKLLLELVKPLNRRGLAQKQLKKKRDSLFNGRIKCSL